MKHEYVELHLGGREEGRGNGGGKGHIQELFTIHVHGNLTYYSTSDVVGEYSYTYTWGEGWREEGQRKGRDGRRAIRRQ